MNISTLNIAVLEAHHEFDSQWKKPKPWMPVRRHKSVTFELWGKNVFSSEYEKIEESKSNEAQSAKAEYLRNRDVFTECYIKEYYPELLERYQNREVKR